MFSIDYFAEIVEKAVAKIVYPQQPAGLYAPIRYTLEGGGKRLRPVLLMASAKAFGAEPASVINQALGIEMFHNFTLLHDDVMDNADVRRGRPTVHRRWNNSTAILSGDAMLTMATRLIADCDGGKLPELLRLFNTTAMEIYEGQQFDMDFENRDDVTVDECEAMYRYGELLGLAFQLQDDYLDTYGDPALFGKEIGGDIINEKKTWLWITAMAECPAQMNAVLDKKLTDYLKIKEIKEIYDSLNLPSRSHELIERYASEAVACLSDVAVTTVAKDFFKALAAKSTTRSN